MKEEITKAEYKFEQLPIDISINIPDTPSLWKSLKWRIYFYFTGEGHPEHLEWFNNMLIKYYGACTEEIKLCSGVPEYMKGFESGEETSSGGEAEAAQVEIDAKH